jgi:flagellin
MSLSINTNISSLIAANNLASTQQSQATSMQRLTSGFRINSAADDAAGLAIATSMQSQIGGMQVAVRNANDGVSLVQTADSALSTMSSIFQRMRDLSTQAANGTYQASDYTQMDKEYQSLATEAGRIATSTKYNNIAMISTASGAFSFQVGANTGDTLSITTGDATGYLATPGALTSAATANTAIGALDTALQSLNSDRAVYGAAQNRLGFTVQNLNTSITNAQSAKGRIMDTDYTAESSNLARTQVLQQAGVAMLSQANQSANLVLNLLK